MAVMKHYDKINLRIKSVILFTLPHPNPSSIEVRTGTQAGSWMKGVDIEDR